MQWDAALQKAMNLCVPQEGWVKMQISPLNINSPYFGLVSDAIEFILTRYPFTVCFAGIISSAGYGLGNATSDYDIIVFYECDKNEAIHTALIYGIKTNNVHLLCVDINSLISEKERGVEYSGLPYFLWPHEKFDYSILPGISNCKLRSVITETLFCRKFLDNSNYLTNNFNVISSYLTIYDFLKRQFVSAQGRLTQYMSGQSVRVRSYLYTARDICAIDYILKNQEFPPLGFSELIAHCFAKDVCGELSKLYGINKNGISKEKLVVTQIERLNQCFYEKLDDLKPKLADYYLNNRADVFKIKIF
jgi:predicted nucleotidyltransferase